MALLPTAKGIALAKVSRRSEVVVGSGTNQLPTGELDAVVAMPKFAPPPLPAAVHFDGPDSASSLKMTVSGPNGAAVRMTTLLSSTPPHCPLAGIALRSSARTA